jgi:magnesium-transporting ATPase (P-type)
MPTSDVTESASSTVVEILAKLETDPKTGLNAAQLQERLKKYGPNALAEEKKARFLLSCLISGGLSHG